MNTNLSRRTRVLSFLALCATAGLASAQFTEEYASGLLHSAKGAATLGPVNERRLPVHNIGSSGQDGVEIRMHSSSGGGATIDLGPIMQTPGAKLGNRRKGWDGLIYGTHRIISNGDGTGTNVYDFSSMGATSVRVDEYNDTGVLISSTTYSGPIASKPWVPNWHCSDGSYPVYYEKWVKLCNSCTPVLVQGWYCIGYNGGDNGEFSNNRIIVTPEGPLGAPPPADTESMILTATGVPDLEVSEANLSTFQAQSWGLGSAHMDEVCTSSTGDCSSSHVKLVASNIGSSGQDGVEVKWRAAQASSGSFTLGDLAHGTGQAEASLRYLFGLRGSALKVTGTGTNAVVAPDFSADGATQYLATGYDANGVITQETVLPNGVGITVTVDQVVCGPNAVPVYGWVTYFNYQCQCVKTEWWCVGCMKLGGGGVNWPDSTARVVFTPVNPAPGTGTVGAAVTGSNLASPIEVSNVQWTKLCPADYNDDGFLSGEDFDLYVAAFELGDPSADYNGDGFVSGEDFDSFVAAFELGC